MNFQCFFNPSWRQNDAIFGSEKSIQRGDLEVLLAENKYDKRYLNMFYFIDETKDYELYTFFTPK